MLFISETMICGSVLAKKLKSRLGFSSAFVMDSEGGGLCIFWKDEKVGFSSLVLQ